MSEVNKTNQEILENWKQYLKREGDKPESTITTYFYTLNNFSEFLKGKSFVEVNEEDIVNFIFEKEDFSKNTNQNRKTQLKSFFKWLYKKAKLISELPIKDNEDWPTIKLKKKVIVETINEEDIKKIIEHLEKKSFKKGKYLRDFLIFSIIYYTGLRREEVANIKINDFDFEKCIIKVPCGKGDKERHVPYKKDLNRLIDRYAKHSGIIYLKYSGLIKSNVEDSNAENNNFYLFPGGSNGHIDKTTINNIFQKIKKETGVELARPHKTRATYATTALHNGAPVAAVQESLGHTDYTTTKKYLGQWEVDLLSNVMKSANEKFI